jgi:hypothetical protein
MDTFDNIFEKEILKMIDEALKQDDIQKVFHICDTYNLPVLKQLISKHERLQHTK